MGLISRLDGYGLDSGNETGGWCYRKESWDKWDESCVKVRGIRGMIAKGAWVTSTDAVVGVRGTSSLLAAAGMGRSTYVVCGGDDLIDDHRTYQGLNVARLRSRVFFFAVRLLSRLRVAGTTRVFPWGLTDTVYKYIDI